MIKVSFDKAVVVALIFLFVIAAALFQNYYKIYNGYCEDTSRYFEADEKINIAIQDLISAYPPVVDMIVTAAGVQQPTRARPENFIGYSSINDFKDINPNCCYLTDTGTEGYKVTFWNKLRGRVSDLVRVKYLIRYYDEHGEKIDHQDEVFVPITNCGHTWSGI